MSKHINVNPNFYKVGGREHAEGHGEAVTYDREKQQLARGKKSDRALPGGSKQPNRGGRKR